MNSLKSIIAFSIIATITLSASAQSDELMDIIHPESADLFHYDNHQCSPFNSASELIVS